MMTRTLLVFITLLFASASFAQPELSELNQLRYHALIEELRCLVCQNQNLAESSAPLAVDLKNQVAEMIKDGRSDAEIKDYLIARYGDFVLYRPPFKALTWLLWLGPFLLLGFGLFTAWRIFSSKQVEPEKAVDQTEIDQLLHHRQEKE